MALTEVLLRFKELSGRSCPSVVGAHGGFRRAVREAVRCTESSWSVGSIDMASYPEHPDRDRTIWGQNAADACMASVLISSLAGTSPHNEFPLLLTCTLKPKPYRGKPRTSNLPTHCMIFCHTPHT